MKSIFAKSRKLFEKPLQGALRANEITVDAKLPEALKAVPTAPAEPIARVSADAVVPEANDQAAVTSRPMPSRPPITTRTAAPVRAPQMMTPAARLAISSAMTDDELAMPEQKAPRPADVAQKVQTLQALDGTDLAALLCARLCHDLVSPISAIGAALDVMRDPGAADMHDQALELIRKSAEQGWAKLEFTRLAFGAGGSAPGRMDSAELRRVTEGVFNTEKLAVDWEVEAVEMDKGVARMLLNLCLLGSEALPRGGHVSVRSDVDGKWFRITATGRRARLAPDVEMALSGRAPQDGYDARSIQPYYAARLAARAGGRVDAHMDGETVIFEARFDGK
jgi:histidine phosphotransferase ChpT